VLLPSGDLRTLDQLQPFKRTGQRTPLWLSKPDQNIWSAALGSSACKFVQFNQVADDSITTVNGLASSILRFSGNAASRVLILDVRRNNGGSGALLPPLIKALIAFEAGHSNRKLYILMGRNTFSAAQNFINMAERWTAAIFVGEPSSSRPNFIGEDSDIHLPFSGIDGSIGSRYFQDSDPLDSRQWIPAGIPVSLKSSDYFDGRDPILEAAVRHANFGLSSRDGLGRCTIPPGSF
jgi:hypothetical protein